MSKLRESDVDMVVEYIVESKSILFITGAGVSADSGLPTYRGIGGLYNSQNTEDGRPIEEMLSGDVFKSEPELSWKYLAEIGRATIGKTFNKAHEVIAEIEKQGDRVWTLTQNVDGFHRRAGSKNLIEIHGGMQNLFCPKCSFAQEVKDFAKLEIPPLCSKCRTIMRPDVVLFGEMLPSEAVSTLMRETSLGFDLVFIIGTTAVFPYIAQPVHEAKARGNRVVEINPSESEVSHLADIKLGVGAAQALDVIWNKMRKNETR